MITGKIAKVVSARDLVINRGSKDGVKIGMRFRVLGPQLEIMDPDTGESLGPVEVEKVQVEAVQVHERVAVCRTFKKVVVDPGRPGRPGLLSNYDFGRELMGEAAIPPTYRYQTFRLSEDSASESINPAESYVEVGDVVVQITGKQYDD